MTAYADNIHHTTELLEQEAALRAAENAWFKEGCSPASWEKVRRTVDDRVRSWQEQENQFQSDGKYQEAWQVRRAFAFWESRLLTHQAALRRMAGRANEVFPAGPLAEDTRIIVERIEQKLADARRRAVCTLTFSKNEIRLLESRIAEFSKTLLNVRTGSVDLVELFRRGYTIDSVCESLQTAN